MLLDRIDRLLPDNRSTDIKWSGIHIIRPQIICRPVTVRSVYGTEMPVQARATSAGAVLLIMNGAPLGLSAALSHGDVPSPSQSSTPDSCAAPYLFFP